MGEIKFLEDGKDNNFLAICCLVLCPWLLFMLLFGAKVTIVWGKDTTALKIVANALKRMRNDWPNGSTFDVSKSSDVEIESWAKELTTAVDEEEDV